MLEIYSNAKRVWVSGRAASTKSSLSSRHLSVCGTGIYFSSPCFLPLSVSVSQPLSLSLQPLVLPSQRSPGLHLDLQTPPPFVWRRFNNLPGKIGNVVSSQNWNGGFCFFPLQAVDILVAGHRKLCFIKLMLRILSVNEEKPRSSDLKTSFSWLEGSSLRAAGVSLFI